MTSRKLAAHLLLVSAMAAALGLAELLCGLTAPSKIVLTELVPFGMMRIPDQEGLQPSGERAGEWVPVRVNPQGTRGADIPAVKAQGETRVVCLGDSFVFGGGLGDDESFPAYAQALCGSSPTVLRFINAGGNGHDTRAALAFLRERAKALSVDIAVLGWNWNDLVSILDDATRYARDLPPAWLRRLAIYKFFSFRMAPDAWAPHPPEDVERYRSQVLECSMKPEARPRWLAARGVFREIAELSARDGVRTMALILPEPTWKEGAQFPALERLTTILDGVGIPWIDCQPEFFAALESGRHMIQTIDPSHPSAEAQHLIAQILLRKLRALDWIGSR